MGLCVLPRCRGRRVCLRRPWLGISSDSRRSGSWRSPMIGGMRFGMRVQPGCVSRCIVNGSLTCWRMQLGKSSTKGHEWIPRRRGETRREIAGAESRSGQGPPSGRTAPVYGTVDPEGIEVVHDARVPSPRVRAPFGRRRRWDCVGTGVPRRGPRNRSRWPMNFPRTAVPRQADRRSGERSGRGGRPPGVELAVAGHPAIFRWAFLPLESNQGAGLHPRDIRR